MKTISVLNQKGGCGKSTVAAAIAQAAAAAGKRVLAVDSDGQANLSYMLGVKYGNVPGTYAAITNPDAVERCIQHGPHCDVLAADTALDSATSTLKKDQRTVGLKNALETVGKKYDLCIVDTPPSLDAIQLNAMNAADLIIIPVNTNVLNIQGINKVAQILTYIAGDGKRKKAAILFNRYNSRTRIGQDMTESLEETCKSVGFTVLNTRIREAVAIQEAQTLKENLFSYAPRSKVAQDFQELIKELKI